MSFEEYGKSLAKIGKNIKEMSSNTETENELLSAFNYNIRICHSSVTQLKSLEVPSIIKDEHESLIQFFNDLINAYSLKRDSVDDQSKIIDMETFKKGQQILNEKSKLLKPLLISILLKCNQYLLQTSLETEMK